MWQFVKKKVDSDFQYLEELDEDDFETVSYFLEERKSIIDGIISKLTSEFNDFIIKEIDTMAYSVHYVESMSIPVQGTFEDVHKRYKDYIIEERGKGNGNWLARKRSDVLVNGTSYREFVLDHYGKDKLNKKLAKQFEDDLNTGKIKLPN